MQYPSPRILGISTTLAAVTIWAVFLLGTSWGRMGNFTVEEILFLRLLSGALMTIPIMMKLGVPSRNQGLISTLMLTIGRSAVFPFFISLGLFYAPASDAGAIAPGTLPFWTSLFS